MDNNKDETLTKLEIRLLTNTPEYEVSEEKSIGNQHLAGQYEAVLTNGFYSTHIKSFVSDESLEQTLPNAIAQTDSYVEWLLAGAASLLHFVQCNWTGPEPTADIHWLSVKRDEALRQLSLDTECNVNMRKPELLYFSKIIFSNDKIQSIYATSRWWLFRTNLLHQIVLDEASAKLFDETEALIQEIRESEVLQENELKTLFNLEAAMFYLHHRRTQHSQKYLEVAQSTAKLNLELVGMMGKRTKYQQQEKAQLLLKTHLEKEIFPSRSCEDVPKALDLNDDLRLERISYSGTDENPTLGSLEEAIILAKFFQVQISLPRDKLTDEETTPYLNNVIENTKNWSLKMSSLYQRCVLESNHKRTIERSMCQAEYLIEQLTSSKPPVANRLDLFFTSGMKTTWEFQQMLADLMLSLGMVKGALEIYLKIQLWESVIVCYTIMELKNKAAEIIRQEITKTPTVKLWCLLGDATQDTQCYETAWKLSEQKSSRVQRHWGFYYFSKRNYAEAVPHLKLSAELNNIQENVWIKLGFAALQIEDWKLAATAYRHYCALEQTSFEAWNNLAKAYIKLGDKPRAWRSLQDAVKCNYDRWEVWDNLMVVSIDLGHFSEVIRCYHRILELKSEHIDVEILKVLTRAIVDNITDADGNSARKLLQRTLELFGHLTAKVPNNSEIWRMYGELSATKKTDLDNQKAAQYLQKAHRSAVADPKWFKEIKQTLNVLKLCTDLAVVYLNCSQSCPSVQKRAMLGSAKLSLQGVVKKVKDQEWLDQKEIGEWLEKVEEYLKVIVEELAKINVD